MKTGKLEVILTLVDSASQNEGKRYLEVEDKTYQVIIKQQGVYIEDDLKEAILPELYKVARATVLAHKQSNGKYPNGVEVTLEKNDENPSSN